MSISITVMTFNLHRDGAEDESNSWQHRKEICTTIILKYAAVVVCVQEALQSQLEDLRQALPGYEQFGMSRKGLDDSTEEHCAILYDKEKVERMDGGTFWLSESPSVPGSLSWGMSAPCIATWVKLQLKGIQPPGFAFQVVNTHLDCQNKRAHRRGALLIWQHIASLPPTLPVIFCCSLKTIKDSSAGRFLLGRSREHGIIGEMKDAWSSCRTRKNSSTIYTYHGFKGDNQSTVDVFKLLFKAICLCWDRHNQDLHVDWVLYRGRSLVPHFSEVVKDHIDGQYPSGHYPVYVEFLLPRSIRGAEEF